MKHRGCRLVVPAVLALAVLCFSPPAFGADSTSLASIGPSVGASQSTDGGFRDVLNMPTSFSYKGKPFIIYLRSTGYSANNLGTVNGIPGLLYEEWEYPVTHPLVKVVRLTSGWISPFIPVHCAYSFSAARAYLGLNP